MARAQTSSQITQPHHENTWTLILRDPKVGEALRDAIAKYCLNEDQKSAMTAQMEASILRGLNGQIQDSDADASAQAELDPIEMLKSQAVEYQNSLIERGELVSAEVLAQKLSVKTTAISKALSENRFFYVARKGPKKYFPVFFADPRYDRRQLEGVSKLMGDMPGSTKYNFFVTPKLSLDGKTPLQGLAEGQLNKVLNAARGFCEL